MSDTLELADGVYDADTAWRGMVRDDIVAITAGIFPVKPPSAWFDDPKLTDLTPLTVDATGRVFGHIAAWHTSHIGMAGGIKPPRSKSKYAFFRTGTLETEEGSFVDVGQITLAGGHAPLEASVRETVAHYDDTNTAVMDVAAGEDKYGIWVAGALRPSVSEEQVRTLRASSVSGDWRPINGRLELVAVCAVNCPGFPIPRARVAAGTPIALIAAGVEPLVEKSIQMRAQEDIEAGIRAGLATFRQRITHLEDVLLASADADGGPLASEEADELRARVHGLRGEVGADEPLATDEADALRARVHGMKTAAEAEPVDMEAARAELRKRVRPEPTAQTLTAEDFADAETTTWDDGLDISVPIAAALRSRVHGTPVG